jgi:hypothetical protein
LESAKVRQAASDQGIAALDYELLWGVMEVSDWMLPGLVEATKVTFRFMRREGLDAEKTGFVAKGR